MIRVLLVVAALALLALPVVLSSSWVGASQERLRAAESQAPAEKVAVATAANESYCTPPLQKVLRRVLQSCGLLGEQGRGCQPLEARNVATMSDSDFNALFVPMIERGGIAQFEKSSAELDVSDKELIDRVFADRKGASYFFVVSRASPEGQADYNRALSRERAEKVMAHLEETFHDQELKSQVGLLWLGEEFAQLDPSFCGWTRSGAEEECRPEDLNRSAFMAWIDCTL